MSDERKIENIPIYKIIPNIYQPRLKFDEDSILELAKTIESRGIIQPLILRKVENSYEIIDGERRYKAAKKANLKSVPAIVLEIDDKEAAELILIENMQKQIFSPIEEANAYQQIMLLNKFNIDELSIKLGIDKKTIENKLKLLTLPQNIQESLLNNKISEGHARVLMKIKSKEKQEELFNKVIKERMTVKTLEDLINKDNGKIDKPENNKQKDKINLNELNNKYFLKKEEKNKMEEDKMDNTQLNFNQYNNLLKEQTNIELAPLTKPEPIIESEEKTNNEFFPSLEEQPLNLNVPINNQFEMPSIEQPMQSFAPQMAPTMEVPQMPMMNDPVEMPQFEMPSMEQPMQPFAPQMAPTMEVPQMPMMNEPVEMPQFEIPSMEQPMQPFAPQMAPTMEVPQMPMMNEPVETPQFEMPVMEQPVQNPEQEELNLNKIMIDVMPAVNMIRNLKPLLENCGYSIEIEETDNLNEYQVILKVQK